MADEDADIALFSVRDGYRVVDSVVDFERRPKTRQPLEQTRGSAPATRRMRLISILYYGESAMAVPLAWDDEESQWVPSGGQEEMVRAADAGRLWWPAGADVTVVSIPAVGLMVTSETLQGHGMDETVPPFAVMAVYGEEGHDGVLKLVKPAATFDDTFYNTNFVFLSGETINDAQRLDADFVDDKENLEAWQAPVTLHAPGWAAYEKGKDNTIPEEVLEAFGITDETKPTIGELWGPQDGQYKLRRSLRVLPLYWYSWGNTNIICEPINDDPESTDGLWRGTNVTCNPLDPGDPPDVVKARYGWFIAPNYWWGFGWSGWGYGGWGWNGQGWNYPGWYNVNYGGESNPSWWGNWGYGWWGNLWNGQPPPDYVFDPDAAGTMPQPPAGAGQINREAVYGYVVWQYGWRVLGVDEEEERVFVMGPGPMKFTSRLVVVNPEPTNASTT